MQTKFQEIQFSDADVVNPSDYSPPQKGVTHDYVPWLLHDHGFTLCVVFALCESDALDEAADAGKLDSFLLDPEQIGDYPNSDGIDYLGSRHREFDIQCVTVLELPNPPFSFAALFAASQQENT